MKIATFSAFATVLLLGVTLTACGPQPRQTAEELVSQSDIALPDEVDPVIARVNDSMIRDSDVQREIRVRGVESEQPLQVGDELYDLVVEELIDQKLLALEARSRDLHRSPEARRRMAQAEEQILGNVLLETVVNEATDPQVIERIYDEQIRLIPLQEEIRARHILLETREQAEAARALLEAGEDFADLAVRISLDRATRLDGGDLGYFTRRGVADIFGEIAFATPEGGVSNPFQTEFGWHLLQVVDRRRQPPPAFETLEPGIVQFRTFEQLQELLVELRANADITRREPQPEEALEPEADETDPPDEAPQ